MRVGLNDPALLQNPGFHSCCLHQAIARLLCGLRFVMVARIHQAPGDCLYERVHGLQSAHQIPSLEETRVSTSTVWYFQRSRNSPVRITLKPRS